MFRRRVTQSESFLLPFNAEQSRLIHASDSVSLRLGLLDCSAGAIAPSFTTLNLSAVQRQRMEQDALEEAQSDSDDSDAQIDDDDVDHDVDAIYAPTSADAMHRQDTFDPADFDVDDDDDDDGQHHADAVVADGDDEMDMEPMASGSGESDARSNGSEGQHDDDAQDDEPFEAISAQSFSDEGGASEEEDIASGDGDSSDLEDTQPASSAAAAAAAAAAVTAATSAPRSLAPNRSPAVSRSVVQSGPSGRGVQRMEVHFQILDPHNRANNSHIQRI